MNYSLRVLRPVLEGRASVVTLKRSAEEAYSNRIQTALKDTVWMMGCNNWYTRGVDGKVWNGMTYPWSQARFWYECLFPVWQDWEYTVSRLRPFSNAWNVDSFRADHPNPLWPNRGILDFGSSTLRYWSLVDCSHGSEAAQIRGLRPWWQPRQQICPR